MAILEKVEERLTAVEKQVDLHKLLLFGDPKNSEDEGILGFVNDVKRQNEKTNSKLDRIFTAVIIAVVSSGVLYLLGLK